MTALTLLTFTRRSCALAVLAGEKSPPFGASFRARRPRLRGASSSSTRVNRRSAGFRSASRCAGRGRRRGGALRTDSTAMSVSLGRTTRQTENVSSRQSMAELTTLRRRLSLRLRLSLACISACLTTFCCAASAARRCSSGKGEDIVYEQRVRARGGSARWLRTRAQVSMPSASALATRPRTYPHVHVTGASP